MTATSESLINPDNLSLNINGQAEDDEEDIEEEKRRKEMLNAQLEHAFDDWSESEHEEDSGNSSSSDEEHRNHKRNHKVQHNGMVFRKLSNISERSPSKTDYNSSEQSKEGGNNSNLQDRYVFSPPRSVPFKFIQANGGPISSMDGRGDELQNSNNENEKFEHIFTNSSHNEQSQSLIDDIAEAYRKADYNSIDQLRVLYEVRMREIKELEAEKHIAANEKQDMFRRLALMEAEKQRAEMSRTEAGKLLVACKEEINKLQNEIESQKEVIEALEKDKKKGDETTELLRIHIQELEQRIDLMERFDTNKTAAKQTEAMIKELKNKHHQEVNLIQREVDSLNKKLHRKEEDCKDLEHKITELQRAQELFLVEKAETINHLARQLEESQAQCGQLMSSNMSVDNVRLQTQLAQALRENEELNQTVKNLKMECNLMRSDLTQYESLNKLAQTGGQSSSDETDSIVQLGISSRHSSKHRNLNTTDTVTKLKDELHRALLNQKAKRSEIQRLQEIISEKDKQIREMMEQERVHLSEIETVRGQLNKMMTEVRSLQDSKEAKTDPNNKSKSEEILLLNAQVAELTKEKAVLERQKSEIQRKLDDLTKQFEEEKKREISNHSKEYLKFHDEIVAKVRKEEEEKSQLKIKEYSVRLDQSQKEVNELKEMYVAVVASKEEIALSLSEATKQLQEITAERDKVVLELGESKQLADQLARQLNEAVGEQEGDKMQAQLKEFAEMKNHLARRVNIAERENARLVTEVDKLKAELENKLFISAENQECGECAKLRAEVTAMSERHTQELTCARTELQAARDRLLQLEKSARQQFDTEIKTLRQDRDMLKTKCDEKENQIKKLIDSRKRPPATTIASTQTEPMGQIGQMKEGWEELEKRLREEYYNNLVAMEQAHQRAEDSVRTKSKEEIERIERENKHLLEEMKNEMEQQVTALKASHEVELHAVEERTKQLTLEFCAAQIKKVEEKYIEEACRRADPSVLESLQRRLNDKNVEVDALKQRLAAINEENHKKLIAMQQQIDTDRDNATQLMVQWAQELKNLQGELKIKEAIIDDQRSQLQKARAKAEKLRNKLIKTNEKIESEYTSKCNQYKAELLKIVEEQEKLVNEKVKQMEQSYENKIKELKRDMNKKKHIS